MRATVTSDKAVRREFRKYYVWLYSPKRAQRVPQLETALSDRPVSDLDRRRLEGSIEVEETIRAIRSIGLGKSAGPDGLPAEVYKAHEKIAAPLLTRLYNQALVTGTLAFTLREGDIILLYKKEMQLSLYRPFFLWGRGQGGIQRHFLLRAELLRQP